MVPILSLEDAAALSECEAIIRRGLGTFVEVGFALARIRDSKLYRAEFGTFEDYCSARWDMSARRARQLWDAAEVIGQLRSQKFSALPMNESQTRPLTELPREEQVPAWEEAVGTAPGGRITASHVANVVQRRLERLGRESNTQSQKSKVQEAGTRAERARALASQAQAALRELQDVIGTADGVPTANVRLAIRQMDDLQNHLARKDDMLRESKQEKAERREMLTRL
jgi:hypothetical protein